MAKGALTVVNENVDRQIQRKKQSARVARKQMSAETNLDTIDQKVFKEEKKLKTAEKVEVVGKENTPILRRSKRKVTAPLAVKHKADLSLVSKTKKSNTKNHQNLKTKSTASLELLKGDCTTFTEETRDKTQTYSNLSSVSPNQNGLISSKSANSNNPLCSSPLNVSDDSGFESSTRVSDQSLGQTQPVLLAESTKDLASDNDASILTSGSVSLNYWMELAEQRRKSLETALQENELLHDQLVVLEAENSQLKQLVKEAEQFAKIVEGIVK